MTIHDNSSTATVEIHSKVHCAMSDLKKTLSSFPRFSLVERGETLTKFNATEFFELLREEAGEHGRVLVLGSRMTSTQQILSTHSSLFPEGTLLVCDYQSHGKGRGSNTWISSEGCLMFSFTSNFSDGRSLPCVQYIASIAMIEAVKDCASRAQGTQPEELSNLKIKWPNDLYYRTKKIGGVLCSSVFTHGVYCTTVGVGLNVTNKEPSVCLQDLLGEALTRQLSREALLAAFLLHFNNLKAVFRELGFAGIRYRYLSHWLHSNQQVKIVENRNGQAQEVNMVIKGLTDAGLLLAEDIHGDEFELTPDGNSLDFFSGLIRKKL